MLGEIVTQVVREKLRGCRRIREDSHMTFDASCVLLHVATQLFELRQDNPGMVKKRLAWRGEGNPLAGPIQQLCPHAFLEIFDPGAGGGY
jgi:hypothetical protein